MLHITNGDATLRLMGPAGLPGEFLPWRDVLHEGPVPAGLDLEVLAEGEKGPGELFRACQVREQSPFMGDWSFWRWLDHLGRGPAPLLEAVTGEDFAFPPAIAPDETFRAQRLRTTQTGRAVLEGRQDWLAIHPIDRWLGGVHLAESRLWRWNAATRHLARDARPA